ncbi:MAG: RHS repeat-associated core domain-containing protein [Flavobacterium sp. JAD_PAG50586_2]|nr:MAG: RHS repeat-associated core domain-containing protein [Flavobacterium sp. JAD_PAG50586_2]
MGEVLKIQDAQGNSLIGFLVLDRGYTGHEHLQSVGLIHMNARLYDPKLHRFLQPDNFIQDPSNTQNFNRYGYVLNNPLKYTDPSGEFFVAAVLIGAAIAALTYTITAMATRTQMNFGGLLQSAAIGAFSGAVTFGIGTAASTLFSNAYSIAAFEALAHGTFQGMMSGVQGGNFWTGFASGCLASVASSAWVEERLLKIIISEVMELLLKHHTKD